MPVSDIALQAAISPFRERPKIAKFPQRQHCSRVSKIPDVKIYHFHSHNNAIFKMLHMNCIARYDMYVTGTDTMDMFTYL